MKLTVKQKIYLSFISIISILIAITMVIYTQLVSAEYQAHAIKNDDVPAVTLYLTLVDESGDIYRDALKIIANFDANAKQDFYENLEQYRTALAQLIPLESANQSDRNNMQKIESYIDQFQSGVENQIIASVGIKQQSVLFSELHRLSNQHLVPLEALLDELSMNEKAEAEKALNSLLESFYTMESASLILTAIGTLVSIIVAYLLANSITSRLQRLTNVSQKVANGDLTSEGIVDNVGDELSELANSINTMQSSLKELISSIALVSNQVQTASSAIADVSNEMVNGASDQAARANLIATASEELSLTINEVAQQAASTADMATLSGDSADNGRHTTKQMINSIENVAIQIEDMSSQMQTLHAHSDQIGGVIKVIEDIASQTNLLALNAAIEAARAGELGRGFAVVADEVRALAERTTQATNEVGNIIKVIQSGTEQAVNSTVESKQLTEIGVSQSAGANTALEQIVDSTQNVKSMVHAIATAAEEQTAVTKEIATDITIIHDISEQTLELAARGADNSRVLAEKVSDLDTLLTRFKLS
ncbi:methyl-accepting chemotaxis protein [Shewanella sairae]|uniref:Methyl-accepting chemotaxis protein n=1 Tax=Shewanella sairae TaxID=190310 RepID=A0ABQ4P214_9GAMM|nr:methyl-accepting chemotaxis protein [Shewanella sairae]MCL1129640.1 methyl-accepting chemotaxis protein [Shewanella sairae]GIU41536.1 methyl-accepting chemotaxis protein [Shewanella sairae]